MIHHSLSNSPSPAKSAQSAEIKIQTAAFQKSGVQIQQIPNGLCKSGSVDSMRQYPEVSK